MPHARWRRTVKAPPVAVWHHARRLRLRRAAQALFGSYDLFNSLRDPALGYAADDDRLVQRWVWFSAGYDLYPTGDLFTRDGRPTGLMHALSAYLAEFGP